MNVPTKFDKDLIENSFPGSLQISFKFIFNNPDITVRGRGLKFGFFQVTNENKYTKMINI